LRQVKLAVSERMIRGAMQARFLVTAKVKCFNCSFEELITDNIKAANASEAKRKFLGTFGAGTERLCEECLAKDGTRCALQIIEPPPLTVTALPVAS